MRRMIGFLMMVGLVIGVGCGDDDSSPTSSSVSQDKYSETIVGTWYYRYLYGIIILIQSTKYLYLLVKYSSCSKYSVSPL